MTGLLRIALASAVFATIGLPSVSAGATLDDKDACARHAPEAALRSRLPVDVILRVMLAESRGRSHAVSPKGAMGCMQIMPPTWAYLAARYGLGSDPYDPRMNMIAGSLYLAELARQFGFPSAFSAYNAGPGRYIRYVRDGVPLPAETIAYAAQINSGTAVVRAAVSGLPPRPRWQEAHLFMTRPVFKGTAVLPAVSLARNMDVQPRNALFPFSRAADGGDITGVRP